MTPTIAPALALEPRTYIGPEEITARKSLLQKVAIFGILLGSGLLLASFYTAIPLLLGAAVTAFSIYALHYISNADSKLSDAASEGNRCMLKFLLFLGANPNANPNESALQWAAHEGHSEIVRDLLTAGADPNINPNNSPLKNAATFGYAEIAEELLAANADVNLKDSFDETPLSHAVCESQDNVVAILLNLGADPTIQPRGVSPALTPNEWARYRRTMYEDRLDSDAHISRDTRTREERKVAANRIANLLEIVRLVS